VLTEAEEASEAEIEEVSEVVVIEEVSEVAPEEEIEVVASEEVHQEELPEVDSEINLTN
jgi:hypothetical protein